MKRHSAPRLLIVLGLATVGVLGALLSNARSPESTSLDSRNAESRNPERTTTSEGATARDDAAHAKGVHTASVETTDALDSAAEPGKPEKQALRVQIDDAGVAWVKVGVRVEDPGGEPLPGLFATLRKRVGNVISDHAGWVKTDIDGHATFHVRVDALPLKPVLRGDPEGRFVASDLSMLAITRSNVEARLVLENYTPLRVLIETRDGTPIPYARVEAWGSRFATTDTPVREPGQPPRWFQIATANREGLVDMTLPGAVERVVVRVAPSWGRDRVRHRGAHVETELLAGDLVRAVVDPRESVSGTVVDETGKALPGVYIRAWPVHTDHRDRVYLPQDHKPGDGPEPPLVVESIARSDDEGRFSVRLGRPGPHYVVAIPDLDASRAPSEAAIIPSGASLRLACPRYRTIEGRLLADQLASKDLTGFRIELHPQGYLQRASEATDGSDPDGTFAVRVRPGTRYTVRAVRNDDERIHFGEYEATTGARMTLALAPGRRLTGRIDDMPADAGAAEVVARLGRFAWQGRIDESGQFEIGPLPPEVEPTGYAIRHAGREVALERVRDGDEVGEATAFSWPEEPLIYVGFTPPR